MLSIILNVLIAVLPVAGFLMLARRDSKPGRFAEWAAYSFGFFTVLSNFFAALVAACRLVLLFGGSAACPLWLAALKLSSATAVGLTFLTVVVLLGRTFGWKEMYSSGNLLLHLVVPLLAMADLVLCADMTSVPFALTAIGMLPTFAYGAWYVWRIVSDGRLTSDNPYDLYGFLSWGWSKVPLVAAVMLGASWGCSVALWACARMLRLA